MIATLRGGRVAAAMLPPQAEGFRLPGKELLIVGPGLRCRPQEGASQRFGCSATQARTRAESEGRCIIRGALTYSHLRPRN